MTSAYCRTVCKAGCKVCPRPRLLPDAQIGVAAYMAVATQWRQGFGGRTGLDYSACITTLGMHLPRWRREAPAVFKRLRVADLMEDVQIIERAVLEADAERNQEEQEKREAERTSQS